jgi:dimeric dUTPase (all-alpha-NTP-PPase superfamily)
LDYGVMANNFHFYVFAMDKLDRLLKLQKELSIELASERYPSTMEQRISSLCIAIIHESVELQRLTNWKWWKRPREFDIENAKGELIDMWHFLLQASIELGMTADDILQYYMQKNEINKIRRKSNY